MNCGTCKYESNNKCAVNPINCKGAYSKACKEYKHDESKEAICGNCVHKHMGECTITGANVESDDEASYWRCGEFISHAELDSLQEENEYEDMRREMEIIEVKLYFNEDKSLKKLVLVE